MKEILVTSSVLIAVLLILRQVFRRSISRRVQYALWGLVLLRLLVPISLPALDFSVLTASEPAVETVSQHLEQRKVYVLPTGQVDLPEENQRNPELQPGYEMAPTSTGVMVVDDSGKTATVYAGWMTAGQLLRCVWLGGTSVMVCWFLVSNLRFWRKLRKERTPYAVDECRRHVYLVESGLPSPCLFGLFRPAIYLTSAAVETPESLRHVIAHEETHARHLDPLWSLLRCVCLAVYWFDPLVWAAAIVSKTDCELACDEGALKRLGEAERIPYGKTLLSLIPVRKKPANPLLSATTMTAGKRQLKDRITRIAENRQTAAAALFLVLTLAAFACVMTFTGAKTTENAAREVVPLTEEELTQFSEDFNNEFHPIRSQFLSSLYERPEDIDLLQLFYNGTGMPEGMGTEERAEVVERDYQGYDPEIDLIKCDAANMDAVLEQYTGLTLAETNQVGMEAFTYLEQYGAYYHFHGDTNARTGITFLCGEREGDLVRLYYDDAGFDFTGWKCVTLREYPDESVIGFPYRFVSNVRCDRPGTASSMVYPDWDPELTISLKDLTPYFAGSTAVQHRTNDLDAGLYQWSLDGNGRSLCVYRSTDGGIYAAVVTETLNSWQADCFLALPDENYTLDRFFNLFGHDGYVFSYYGLIDETATGRINDYYYFEEDGDPRFLLRACGDATVIDMDGNGENEVLSTFRETSYLFFHRDNAAWCVDIGALLAEHWPELTWWGYSYPDEDRRCLTVSGFMEAKSGDGQASFVRSIYFDGENLLVYKDQRQTVDHVLEGIDAPAYIMTAARTHVQDQFVWWQQHSGSWTYIDGEWQDVDEPAAWDDWRITALEYVPVRTISTKRPEIQAEVYTMAYQLHTTTPEMVQLAGGMYCDEDGWVGGFYDEDDTMVFLVSQDGTRTQLENRIAGDVGTGSPMFYAGLADTLIAAGALRYSDVNTEVLSAMFYDNAAGFLNQLSQFPTGEQVEVLKELVAYRDDTPEKAYCFDDPMEALWYNSNGLTEAGAAAYRRLMDISNNESEIPSKVRTTATAVVRQYYENKRADEAWDSAGLFNFRVEDLSYVYTYPNFHLMEVEVYRMNYEFLAANPENVTLAGGMYATEDGWVCPTYPDSTYLFFQRQADGNRTYLYAAMENDCSPGDGLFTSDMEHRYFADVIQTSEDGGDVSGSTGYPTVSHTQEEYDAAVKAVREHLTETARHPNVVSLEIQFLSADVVATGRVSRLYADSPVSKESGLDNTAMTRMIAVRAVYDIQWIPSVAARSDRQGLVTEIFYLLPEAAYEGSWAIWTSIAAE